MIWINIVFAFVFFTLLTQGDYTGKRWQYYFDGFLFSFNVAIILMFFTS